MFKKVYVFALFLATSASAAQVTLNPGDTITVQPNNMLTVSCSAASGVPAVGATPVVVSVSCLCEKLNSDSVWPILWPYGLFKVITLSDGSSTRVEIGSWTHNEVGGAGAREYCQQQLEKTAGCSRR